LTERIQKFSDPPMTVCPHCGGEVEQLLSAPAVQFKGSGWYVTDYAKKSSSSAKGNTSNGNGSDSGSSSESKSDSSKSSDSSSSSSSENSGKSNANSEKPAEKK
jgi:putative FmdB family regulatory protein